nr:bifunctional phosphoribosylaminoimidazolecarboxamide formyltransferase/IMP cyclohydrolase [Actinomycetota bacterium]
MRALLSVWDKTGLEALAKGLVGLGWELVSSGGTSTALAAAGIEHVPVEAVTGSPEMLGGRVKTLHPKIHGGILADRDKADHVADLEANAVTPIDLVVCNLYPFRSEPGVEMIDIGGPTMVRAAAKNHAHVGVVVDPADYGAVLDELRRDGELSAATRIRLARAAFAHTAAYDAAIVGWLDGDDVLPPTIHIALERAQELRYGENPHQRGARYRETGTTSWWDGVVQHGGMALSYLNLYDAEAAWQLAHDLRPAGLGGSARPAGLGGSDSEAAVAIIKHANPCGVAVAADIATAYRLAYECDEKSAFGGIVAFNRPVTSVVTDLIAEAAQADVVIAPGYEPGTIEAITKRRKNTRILEAPPPGPERRNYRQIGGGFLVQEPHHFEATRNDWRVATKRQPTDAEWRDAEMAWRLCGHVKSNAVVLVANGQGVGIGAGQQSRVDAGEIAAKKAAGRAKGGACGTDAFYPF